MANTKLRPDNVPVQFILCGSKRKLRIKIDYGLYIRKSSINLSKYIHNNKVVNHCHHIYFSFLLFGRTQDIRQGVYCAGGIAIIIFHSLENEKKTKFPLVSLL